MSKPKFFKPNKTKNILGKFHFNDISIKKDGNIVGCFEGLPNVNIGIFNKEILLRLMQWNKWYNPKIEMPVKDYPIVIATLHHECVYYSTGVWDGWNWNTGLGNTCDAEKVIGWRPIARHPKDK